MKPHRKSPGEARADREVAPTKQDAILEAATEVFMDQGYGAASMDTIAREAGVAKQTVYSHFGGKDALFGATIRKRCDQLMEPIRRTMDTRSDDPETALYGIARRFLGLVLVPKNMAHFRAVIAENERFPKLAEAFYLSGPKLAMENLAAYLADMDAKGLLAVPEPEASANLFFGMLRGDLYMRQLLGLGPEATADDIDRAARRAVGAFLAAHRRR